MAHLPQPSLLDAQVLQGLLGEAGGVLGGLTPELLLQGGEQLSDGLLAGLELLVDRGQALVLGLGDLDGTLRCLPLAALHDGERWLVERYALDVYTALGKRHLDAPRNPAWQVAGLGDSQGRAGLRPLPGVAQELDGIVSETEDPRDQQGVLPGTVHLDQGFDRAALHRELGAGREVIHIASHFVFDPTSGRDSYLLLGAGEPLTLEELLTQYYRFDGIDLVTLSACETALDGAGSGQGGGREIEGLASLVQRRGARGVMASLWPVADASTAWLMQRFYDLREHRGLSKAEALRRAQTELMRIGAAEVAAAGGERRPVNLGAGADFGAAQEPAVTAGHGHPYYWAPFVLMGNWF